MREGVRVPFLGKGERVLRSLPRLKGGGRGGVFFHELNFQLIYKRKLFRLEKGGVSILGRGPGREDLRTKEKIGSPVYRGNGGTDFCKIIREKGKCIASFWPAEKGKD